MPVQLVYCLGFLVGSNKMSGVWCSKFGLSCPDKVSLSRSLCVAATVARSEGSNHQGAPNFIRPAQSCGACHGGFSGEAIAMRGTFLTELGMGSMRGHGKRLPTACGGIGNDGTPERGSRGP